MACNSCAPSEDIEADDGSLDIESEEDDCRGMMFSIVKNTAKKESA
jgi:hypothetical protein